MAGLQYRIKALVDGFDELSKQVDRLAEIVEEAKSTLNEITSSDVQLELNGQMFTAKIDQISPPSSQGTEEATDS